MKTKIYWFSGTGNSLAVAKTLAEKLPDVELIPIAAAVTNPPEAADRIGIVCPVYAFGPPAIVERFIRKLKAAPGTYIFAVFTCAASAGSSVHFLRGMLRKRGLDLSAAWIVKMPENYPPLGGTPGPKSQQKTHAAAEQKVAQILAQLQQGTPDVKERPSLFWRIAGRFIYPGFRWFELRGADRFFRADAKCNGCGLCAKVCPVENICMNEGAPEWLGRCEQCFACFHWCPQQAVQYGFSSRLRRYHHPAVSVSDFVLPK
ncbi:MAG: EFR1 family ferrodoxin [Pontiellaceae bacterium]|jgi:ferredoxin|nr:EFR1 family ferrodoxin [Pontiellaceae bacterium]